MNVVTLIGRMTRDPDIKYIQSADGNNLCMARFNVAIDRPKKSDGTKEADFPSCVAFGHTAEVIAEYMHKGNRIAITGHISTGSYVNKDGITVYTTDVYVDRFDFVDKKENKTEEEYIPF